MIYPFSEEYESDITDNELIKQAIEGDKRALDNLIRRHQHWVYNIALRMLFYPEDAKDATQEVLIKIITKLSTFEGKSSFRTWLYRICVNHILNVKKSMGEKAHTDSFKVYGSQLDKTPDNDLPDNVSPPVDAALIIEEVKISCMFGMLLCLDREQRMIYILGSIFGVKDTVGSEIMEISRDNFRQKLSRARKELYNFMSNKCGLVDSRNPCRCKKKTKSLIDVGYVNPQKMRFTMNYFYTVEKATKAKVNELGSYIDSKCNKLFLEHPFQKSPDFIHSLNSILKDNKFRNIMNLN